MILMSVQVLCLFVARTERIQRTGHGQLAKRGHCNKANIKTKES